MRTLTPLLFLFAVLALPAHAQLPTSPLDNFDRANANVLGELPGSGTTMEWSESGEAVGSGSSLEASETIRLMNERADLQAGQKAGVKIATVDMSSISDYPTTLQDASGIMTWAFNMRQSKANPGGFGSTGDGGVLFSLAASGTDLDGSNVFAVIIGDGDDTDAVKLVNYNGGYSANGDLVKIVEGSTDRSNEYVSVKVTYDPTTSPDTWTLYARSDANSFPVSDPRTLGASDEVGQTQQDFSGTSNSRKIVGLLWDHGATSASAVFDDIYVTDPGANLPVELATFDATADGDAVHLRWKTASETRNAGFEVQRATEDGFETLGFVDGAGTTSSSTRYTYTAKGLSPGQHTFRLKQVDVDGSTSPGPTRAVTVRPQGLHLAPRGPNPVQGEASVPFRLATHSETPVTVTLHDVLGRTLRTVYEGRVGPEGRNLSVPLRDLANGVYFVRVQGSSATTTRRITVAR